MKNSSSNSTKGFTVVEVMIVVVIISLLAAMAIPAFQKLRQSAQDKAVLDNARRLAVAAEEYFLKNGVSTVTLDKLVGPTNLVTELKIVANETYPLTFSQGVPVKVTGVAGARTVVFPP
jgi:type IV pilus assembly protein PilA